MEPETWGKEEMRIYYALIREEKDTCYGVDFPDFPGCISAGDTIEETQANALKVLDFHAEGMVQDGIELPEPTGLDEILKDKDNRECPVLAIQVTLTDKWFNSNR